MGLYLITSMLIVMISTSAAFVWGQSESVIEVGKFSAQKPGDLFPAGWKPLIFNKVNRLTDYTLVQDGNTVVVKAHSNASASGLFREMRIDPKKHSLVKWRWKVNNILKKSNIHRREGDDYPARIYIAFEDDPKKLSAFEKAKSGAIRLLFGESTPSAVISYIWESKEPIGTIAPAFYSTRAMMIVVESGSEKLHRWVSEERNVYEDYKQAFGQEPPMISGVAIVTETDNTGESATAYYGDISFVRPEPMNSR
jgi:hypothetical protein